MKLLATGLLTAMAVPAFGLMLNEIRVDQPGNPDDEEFVEIKGTPGESLDGVWFLYLGDHSGEGSSKGSGVVEIALNLSGYSIPADGLFLMIGSNFDGDAFGLTVDDVDYLFEGFGNALENSDNTTPMLVRGFTGNGGAEIRGIDDQLGEAAVDIDDNDDGVPNEVLPWTEVIDAVGIFESPTSGEFNYGAAFGGVDVGPDGTFSPSHIYRTSDTEEWMIGEYVLFEEDANQNVIGINPDATDSPGSANPLAPPPVMEPTITALSTIFALPGDVLTVTGDNLDLVTKVTIGGRVASFSVDGDDLLVTVPSDTGLGTIEVTNPDGVATSANIIVPADGATALLAEDFSSGLNGFTVFSVASNRDWIATTFGDSASIEENGFGADVASDDWLITPAIDLGGVLNPILRLGHERVFSGPALEVKISTDYTGSGSPASATWTDLSVPLAGDNSREITDSGEVDLSDYEGETVYVAIRYTTAGTGPGEGAIDRIHYVVVDGESLGWKQTADFGWLYYLTSDWAQSADLGTINIAEFPWVYQVNFGYLYHSAFLDGFGFWLYSPTPTLQWLFVAQWQGGWFSASGSNWEYDNFINPQE